MSKQIAVCLVEPRKPDDLDLAEYYADELCEALGQLLAEEQRRAGR